MAILYQPQRHRNPVLHLWRDFRGDGDHPVDSDSFGVVATWIPDPIRKPSAVQRDRYQSRVRDDFLLRDADSNRWFW